MMVKPIHQHWEYGSKDDPKLNEFTIVAIFSIVMNPQLSVHRTQSKDMPKCCSIIEHLHIVDVVVSHCFPSFHNYGGLLIVTLFIFFVLRSLLL